MGVQRQARGEERRDHILRATLELIGRRGVEAITHRAVGEAAGVPLGSVTYYFPTKDGLLRDALDLWVSDEVERLERLAESIESEHLSPSEGAARWDHVLRAADPEQLAQFELYLQTARTPELQASAAEAFAAYDRMVTAALRAAGLADPEDAAPLFVALAGGLALRRLATGGRAPPLDQSLVTLFEALARAPRS